MTSPRYDEKETNDGTRWNDNKKRKIKTSPGGTTIRKEREKKKSSGGITIRREKRRHQMQ